MLAMQYSIQLPGNYDLDMIGKRVRERSKLFDAHEGLVHKSFIYNDREKIYAPFYVWRDAVGAREFLLDDLFKGVVEAFTRHRVRNWFVISHVYGNRAVKPTYCLREIDVIAPEAPLDASVRVEMQAQEALIKNPNLYMHLLALDADRWEMLHFSLWKDKASAEKSGSDATMEYDVLHMSEPK